MQKTAENAVWYREPWPWIAMAGPAAAIIGCLISAYLAIVGADPVIDEDYYRHGLQINRELAREQETSRLPLRTDLQLQGVRRGE